MNGLKLVIVLVLMVIMFLQLFLLKEEDWELAGEWMWENREYYNGLSVLPYDGGTYVQPPFEDITEEQYNTMFLHFKK